MDRAQVMEYEVFVGIDVGKSSNYVVALDRFSDERIMSQSVIQEESAIMDVLARILEKGKVTPRPRWRLPGAGRWRWRRATRGP